MTELIKNQIVTYFTSKAHVFPVKTNPQEEVSVKVTEIKIEDKHLYFNTAISSPSEVFWSHNTGMEDLIFNYIKTILRTYFSCYEPIDVQISIESGDSAFIKYREIFNISTQKPHRDI